MASKLVTVQAPNGEQLKVDEDEIEQYLVDHPDHFVVEDDDPKSKREKAGDKD